MAIAGERRLPAVRRCVEEMEEYIPVSTPESLAEKLGLRLDQIVKLDANENPYGCSPRVQGALAEFASYHRYPDPWQEESRALLARYLEVPRESLVLGMGSDELIDSLMRLYLEPGDEVVSFPPTFGMYAFSTHVNGGRLVEVPRVEHFDIDVARVERVLSDRTKMIFLDSPNNPSGALAARGQIDRLLATGRLVVVDEAYAEFASASLVPLVERHPNLVVLRTFSKWAGLAGLRVGYGVFPREVLRQLWKIKQPYNLNVAAQVAVRESLLDTEWLLDKVRLVVAERERLAGRLNALGTLRVYPSQANFLLCDILEGNAQEIVEFLASRGIIVRYFRKPRLLNSLRISVGRPEQSDALLAALKDWWPYDQ